jgi:hypothetical protein
VTFEANFCGNSHGYRQGGKAKYKEVAGFFTAITMRQAKIHLATKLSEFLKSFFLSWTHWNNVLSANFSVITTVTMQKTSASGQMLHFLLQTRMSDVSVPCFELYYFDTELQGSR